MLFTSAVAVAVSSHMAAVDRRAAVCSPLPSVVNLGYEDLTGVGRWPPTPNTCQVSGKLMSLALSRKWRPARFDQVIGQEHITRTLQAAVTADRVGHAYLFCCLLYTSRCV